MLKTILSLALMIALATPAFAQVPTNSSTAKMPKGHMTIRPDGSSSYSSGGYSTRTDSKGNNTTSYGGYTSRNGVTQQPPQKYKY